MPRQLTLFDALETLDTTPKPIFESVVGEVAELIVESVVGEVAELIVESVVGKVAELTVESVVGEINSCSPPRSLGGLGG